jgi:hypothetical protein
MENECPICLSVLENNDIITVSCCKQHMHAECYMEFLLKTDNYTCPLCREPINYRLEIEPLREIIIIDRNDQNIQRNIDYFSYRLCYSITSIILLVSIYNYMLKN